MTKNKLVSVIIANYNNQIYLEQCLNSVLAQTYENIEIVVVDDCSTDNSLDLLRKYEEKYPQIKVFVNEKNSGVTKTRMNAIAKAAGDYITTLDADDYYMCEMKIEKEMELISKFKNEQNKDIVAFSNYNLVDINGGLKINYAKSYKVQTGNIMDVYFLRKKFCPRDFVMSKHQYYAAGSYDEQMPIYEDIDLDIRLASKYEFHYTGCEGTAYRDTKKGLSASNIRYKNKWSFYERKKNFHLLKKKKYLIKANTYLEYYVIILLQYIPTHFKQSIKRCIHFGYKTSQ